MREKYFIMYFTSKEKQAIQRLIAAMAMADGKIEMSELILNSVVNSKIGISTEDVDASNSMDLQQAVTIVKQMTPEEKRLVCAYLGSMLAIDNDIDKKEMLLWTLLTMQCDFPQMTIAEANSIISNLK